MVWRCTCFTCLSAMVSVPFRAMYGAKQEIAELTVYSFAQTICRVTFLYYMVTHPGVWLAPFALGSAVLVVVPQVIIALRALVVYPECKIMPRYFVDWGRLKDLARFAGCQLWGSLSGLATGQGQAIVLNKYFGAAANAANGISYQVTSHICTLAGSLNGAFSPALMNAAGADEWERVKRFMFVVCRVGSILLLIFVIPAALEMDQLLLMWLKTPPAYTCPLCLCALFGAVCEQMTEGYSQAIYAKGKIGNYQFWIGNACFAAFFGAWIMAACGVGVMSIGYAYILLKVQVIVIRLVCGRRVMGYSIGEGLRRIILPIFILMIIVGAFAIVPQLLMQASFGRVCVTTIVAEIVLLPFAWIFLFDKSERDMVHDRFLSKILGRLGWPRRCAAEQEG